MKRGRPPHDDILTPRQWQVVALLQEGLTNEQIAARLGITADGAKYHVAEILSKLGVSTREDAAHMAPPRRQPAFVPWLLALRRHPAPALGSGLAFVVLVAFVSFFALARHGSEGGQTPPSSAQVGLDLGTATLPNTVLFSKGTPADVSTYGPLLAGLRHVATAEELRAALSPNVRLIVIDRSALNEARKSSALRGQVAQGRAVLGLNITNAELRDLTNMDTSPAGSPPGPPMRAPSTPDGFYSYLLFGSRGDLVMFSAFQRYFFERVFEEDITRMDAGQIPDTSSPPLPIAQLPEERISVNRGMGCTFDDAKTAAVTKREVAALQPNLKAMGLMIAYCNPGPTGSVIIGVVLPPPDSLVRLTAPESDLR